MANSNAIITQSGTTASSYSAAGLCEAYAGGGYSDWFLPSKDELAQLYAQRDAGQWGGFEDGYWSSSEYNAFYAWSQYFIDPHRHPVRHPDRNPQERGTVYSACSCFLTIIC